MLTGLNEDKTILPSFEADPSKGTVGFYTHRMLQASRRSKMIKEELAGEPNVEELHSESMKVKTRWGVLMIKASMAKRSS